MPRCWDGLYLATLPAGAKVTTVTFSWTEIALHPTHAVWAAQAEVLLEAGQGTPWFHPCAAFLLPLAPP